MRYGVVLLLYVALAPAHAASADTSRHGMDAYIRLAQAGAMAEGEVRKIDKAAKKITLKHGPIPNLDMPGMTMVFQVADDAMFDKIKVGDKVKFSADKVDGNFTVTKIKSAK